MKKVWNVVMKFNRGHVNHQLFVDGKDALEAIRIAVINNKDSVDCSLYQSEVAVTGGANGMFIPITPKK